MEYHIDEDEFNLPFMKERGYVRRKCKKCGSYFWTLDPDAEVCGEAPCVDYTFFDNPPTRRKYSLKEMRNAFLKFFERNGHEIINPYPVVARWRDDLLITIASIADFQPFVTAGEASPPANPLVISQPCLRFEDIDKVGYTSGRHMTIFEMGGAHAFNDTRINDFKYWKNETVMYHHQFATEELGIPEELITYKEHFWVGGGNAGPDLEGIISGLEVSTLVFMKYKIGVDGKLSDIPILTVDTGYGIERWTWLSQGVYQGFEAVYGDLYKWLYQQFGIEISPDVLKRFALVSPILTDKELDKFDEIVTKLSGDTNMKKMFYRLVDLGKLLDHSKSALFLIKDGAIPSNVKEGYLTRMLIRRILKILDEYGFEYDFIYSLMDRQRIYWSKDFNELNDFDGIIDEILSLEIDKYKRIRENIGRIVSSYLKRGYKPTLDLLIELYDSHGIHPDYVNEYLESSMGTRIEIPFNFTELVAKKHVSKAEEKVERKLLPDDLPKTGKLYYKDQYMSEGYAKIVYKGDSFIVLDKTIFYPTGGGQMHDRGWISNSRGDTVHVVDVVEEDGAIIHYVEGDLSSFKVGDTVYMELDWDRRYSLMKHHTSTHILLSALRKVLGPHIWQAGVVKEEEYAHLDVTHFKIPSREEITKIEELINRVVAEDRFVSVRYLDRGEAERKYGIRIYQGGVVPGRLLRIVEVDGWDVEACGGTHVRRTSELQLIKIVNVEKIQDGVIRFKYVAGEKALKYYQHLMGILEDTASKVNASVDDLVDAVSAITSEIESLENKYRKAVSSLVSAYAKLLIGESKDIDGVKVVVWDSDDTEISIKVGEELDSLSKNYIYISIVKQGRGYNVIVRIGDDLLNRFSAKAVAEYIGKAIFKGFGGKGDEKYYRMGGRIKDDIGSQLKSVVVELVSRYVKR